MAFGDPNPSYSIPTVTPGAGFNALMTRFYDEFGNVQGRNEKAFGYYEDSKAREADAYNRMIREQELARQRQQMLDNERRQEEARQRTLEDQERRRVDGERHKAEMKMRSAARATAAQLQNLQGAGGINYRFTDPKFAADVMAHELPYRYVAMAQGKGSSTYGGPSNDPEGQPDQFAADFREQTLRSGYGRGRD